MLLNGKTTDLNWYYTTANPETEIPYLRLTIHAFYDPAPPL